MIMKHQIHIMGGLVTSILRNHNNGQKLPAPKAIWQLCHNPETHQEWSYSTTAKVRPTASTAQVKSESCAHMAKEGGPKHRGKAMQTQEHPHILAGIAFVSSKLVLL